MTTTSGFTASAADPAEVLAEWRTQVTALLLLSDDEFEAVVPADLPVISASIEPHSNRIRFYIT